MCTTCGCDAQASHHHHHHDHADGTSHAHPHDHDHHDHEHSHEQRISIEQDILGRNNALAERIRGFAEARNILALNIMSSPGSGKTSLLERTIRDLGAEVQLYVVEGDQHTSNDADRIIKTGVPAVQINTGNGCHLEAQMVYDALRRLNPASGSILFVENVGNLVCPAMFDLGERRKVVVVSTTEGDDKPLKYPQMFFEADVVVVNKIDLLPYLPANLDALTRNIHQVNPRARVIALSAFTGDGMGAWLDWLRDELAAVQPASEQRTFFDERAAVWDEINHPDYAKITELLDRLDIRPADRLLDVGTGTGVLIPELSRRAAEGSILGVDLSPKMVEVARRKWAELPHVSFRVCDVEHTLPAAEGAFDKIILFSMFPHLEAKEATVARLASLLAPGGRLMIAHDRSRDFLNRLHGATDHRVADSVLLPVAEQAARFEAAGLRVADAHEDDTCYYIIVERRR
jgi:hydrogenase nickel incorporation protein HypB